MTFLHGLFVSSPPLLLFSIIGLGYFLGHIRIRGFQLNVAAVLFVGLGFGPVFFRIFRERGAKVYLLALGALGACWGHMT